MTSQAKYPSVCIVGGGLAGLITSLNLKEQFPAASIVVVEKNQIQSNTQIAGMRFRLKKSGSAAAQPDEYASDIVDLLVAQNHGLECPQFTLFAQNAAEEVSRWGKLLKEIEPGMTHQETDWFGPQWGKLNQSGTGGRGLSVLNTLKQKARSEGIVFITGETIKVVREDTRVTGIVIRNQQGDFLIESQEIVVANGNAGGTLYESTNKTISNSASELLFNAGFALEGATLNMWHPFGRCKANGETSTGCYETDNLAGAQVWLADGTFDAETTELLADHKAHYHFKEISRRFIDHGTTSTLHLPNGETISARVSLHYSHLGAVTKDGSTVRGSENLYVVGDAGGFLYWSNHQPRLPGFALTHCLVSARICAEVLKEKWAGTSIEPMRELQYSKIEGQPAMREQEINAVKRINTESTLQLEFQSDNSSQVLHDWRQALRTEVGQASTIPLSFGLVNAWEARVRGETEPIFIGQSLGINREGQREMKPLKRRL